MKNKGPDRLYVHSRLEQEFQRLIKQADSPLKDKPKRKIFLLAMAIGFKNDMKISLDTRKEFDRIEYLSDEEKALINSLAIHEDGLEVLLDKNRTYKIAEEYASGGIKKLSEIVFSKKGGSFIKKLESDLLEEFSRLVKK